MSKPQQPETVAEFAMRMLQGDADKYTADNHPGVTPPKVRISGYNTANRTDYVQSDGSTQVMEGVLAERAELMKLKGRKRLDAAFRIRQQMQGVLQCCLCDYPLERYDTKSGHTEACPADSMFTACMRAEVESP